VAAECRSAAAEVEEDQMAVEEVVEGYQHHHSSGTMGQVLQVLVEDLVEGLQRHSQVQHKSSCPEEQLPGVHWCRSRPPYPYDAPPGGAGAGAPHGAAGGAL
jgi:hypothetical protein